MGNSPKFDRAIAKFAMAYADQADEDFEAFKRGLRAKGNSKPKAKAASAR